MFAKIAKFIKNWNDVLEVVAILFEIIICIGLMLDADTFDGMLRSMGWLVVVMAITLLLFAYVLPQPEFHNDL